LTGPVVNASNGPAPFGLFFLSNERLLVAEVSGAVSSYSVATNGTLTLISGSVSSGQTATCWVAATPNRQFAYADNTGSGTVTSYHLTNGTVTLDESVANALEGATSGPIDNGISPDGRFLYVLDGGIGAITVLHIGADGQLTRVQGITDVLPALGAQGLAVR
jgi:6-phosphogluconolactonase (cycloisomerase 2 family)